MTLSYLSNIIFLFLSLCSAELIDFSGETITTRFWDCCKPSCSWNGKARFTQPVQTCSKDESPLKDFSAGTGCNGGNAYSCSDQQPWAVNDTLSYGFAGIFIQGHVEDFWCCACYRLDFTSEPLLGKSMIVQASNTAYDVSTSNRFSLAIPGGNTTSEDACAKQFSVSQSVFGDTNRGVQSKDDCARLPASLRDGCEWRFDWFQDALYPNATFTRVVCPSDLTEMTGCTRSDDKVFANNASIISQQGAAIPASSSATTVFAVAAVLVASLFAV
jgi:hypothetical protein